ncbi:MAG: H-type lectin domain-containing protein [Prosthecobacter sp.]
MECGRAGVKGELTTPPRSNKQGDRPKCCSIYGVPMFSSAVPWKVLSSNVSLNAVTEGWNLAEPEAGAEEEIRTFSVSVIFDAPFFSVPVVQVGLNGFDIDQRDSARLIVKAEAITEFSFQAVLTTWAGSRVYAAEFNWLAIGP